LTNYDYQSQLRLITTINRNYTPTPQPSTQFYHVRISLISTTNIWDINNPW